MHFIATLALSILMASKPPMLFCPFVDNLKCEGKLFISNRLPHGPTLHGSMILNKRLVIVSRKGFKICDERYFFLQLMTFNNYMFTVKHVWRNHYHFIWYLNFSLSRNLKEVTQCLTAGMFDFLEHSIQFNPQLFSLQQMDLNFDLNQYKITSLVKFDLSRWISVPLSTQHDAL